MRQLGLKGALVFEVQSGSPAAQAGIRPTRRDKNNNLQLGDVIVALDGKQVRSVNDLMNLMEGHQPGETVQVTVLRDGQEQKLSVTLEETGQAST